MSSSLLDQAKGSSWQAKMYIDIGAMLFKLDGIALLYNGVWPQILYLWPICTYFCEDSFHLIL